MSKKILTTLLLFISIFSFSQDITGSWSGLLEFPGGKLILAFNILKSGNGYTATMDSPDQNVNGIPVDRIAFEDNKTLTIEIPQAKIVYTADLDASGKFIGNFSQAGSSLPLNLDHAAPAPKPKPNRPQEPKAPFPYYSENVTFENKKENFTLAGTLTLPKKDGKFPVVVLITGSGPEDRNSEILGHKPFLVIADYLTRNGIGVLRFDDRDVGESKGDLMHATTQSFAGDVAAAVDYLKTRKDINSKKIGLIGHSEGGAVAPMVAANNKDINAIVLLAGTGIPGDQLLLQQNYLIGKTAGMTDAELEAAGKTNRQVYDVVENEKDPVAAKKQLIAILTKSYNTLPEGQKPSEAEITATVSQQADQMLYPWMAFFLKYDPATALKNVKCPVLVLNGEKDLQVPPKENTEAIKNALDKAGNKKVTVKIFPNLNHLFQECETGAFEEYEKIEQTFSPDVLKFMSDWLNAQFK